MFSHHFPTLAWLAITEFPLHNRYRCDLSRLLVKFAHVVEASEETPDQTDLQAAKALDGCESICLLLLELHVVVGHKNIRVTGKLTMPPSNNQDPAPDVREYLVTLDGGDIPPASEIMDRDRVDGGNMAKRLLEIKKGKMMAIMSVLEDKRDCPQWEIRSLAGSLGETQGSHKSLDMTITRSASSPTQVLRLCE